MRERSPGISLRFELGDLEQVLRGAADLALAMMTFGFATEAAERRAPGVLNVLLVQAADRLRILGQVVGEKIDAAVLLNASNAALPPDPECPDLVLRSGQRARLPRGKKGGAA